MVGSNCQDLQDILDNEANLGHVQIIQNFYNTIHARVVKEAETKIFASLTKSDYPCGSATTFKSSVIAAKCLAICLSKSKEGANIITEVECSGGGCCQRDTEFCFDTNGNLVLGQTQYSTSGTSCGSNNQCNISCSPNCERIYR